MIKWGHIQSRDFKKYIWINEEAISGSKLAESTSFLKLKRKTIDILIASLDNFKAPRKHFRPLLLSSIFGFWKFDLNRASSQKIHPDTEFHDSRSNKSCISNDQWDLGLLQPPTVTEKHESSPIVESEAKCPWHRWMGFHGSNSAEAPSGILHPSSQQDLLDYSWTTCRASVLWQTTTNPLETI